MNIINQINKKCKEYCKGNNIHSGVMQLHIKQAMIIGMLLEIEDVREELGKLTEGLRDWETGRSLSDDFLDGFGDDEI